MSIARCLLVSFVDAPAKRMFAIGWTCLWLSACGSSPRNWYDCHDTITCQSLAQERERLYLRAVAEEPPSSRAEVTRVDAIVFAHRSADLVYAVTAQGLAALRASTGQTVWSRPDVTGQRMFRAGPKILVIDVPEGGSSAMVHAFDPARSSGQRPMEPTSRCALQVPLQERSNWAELWAFDRAGEIFLFWQGGFRWQGGTPPPEDDDLEVTTCGFLRFDPSTCATAAEPPDRFSWEGATPQPGGCPVMLSDIPAWTASEPKADAGAELRFDVQRVPTGGGGCGAEAHRILRATRGNELVWSTELPVLPGPSCVP